eukprot:gb/GFBE01070497.1/.p1 GENE.gb/GFBE01070497.1/~~gb/GFBE01070497.1/.p1  ORF type:complete len:560 (+),score=99.27 gb/GFBE01070497.1/:1-1680(+)
MEKVIARLFVFFAVSWSFARAHGIDTARPRHSKKLCPHCEVDYRRLHDSTADLLQDPALAKHAHPGKTDFSNSTVFKLASNGTGTSNVTNSPFLESFRREDAALHTGCFLAYFGTLGFAMCLYVLLQQSSEDLRNCTWQLLSGTISLFSTVLLFMAMKKCYKWYGKEAGGHHLTNFISFVRFLILLYLIPALIRICQSRPRLVCALRTAGSHLIGFAGADAFADILHQDPWIQNPFYYFCGASLLVLLLCVLMLGSYQIRDRGSDEGFEASQEQEQIEAAGFIFGFIFSMCARFAITGFLPGSQLGRAIQLHELIWLLVVILFSAVTYVVMLIVVSPVSDDASRPRYTRRLAKLAIETSAMSLGWMNFYFLQWMVWGLAAESNFTIGAGKFASNLILAIASSAIVLAAVVIGSKVAASNGKTLGQFTGLLNGFILQTGFSWEMAVYVIVVEGCTQGEETVMKAKHGLSLIVLILAILTPAWYMHIVPYAQPPTPKSLDEPTQAAAATPAADPAAAPKAAAGKATSYSRASTSSKGPQLSTRRPKPPPKDGEGGDDDEEY